MFSCAVPMFTPLFYRQTGMFGHEDTPIVHSVLLALYFLVYLGKFFYT